MIGNNLLLGLKYDPIPRSFSNFPVTWENPEGLGE